MPTKRDGYSAERCCSTQWALLMTVLFTCCGLAFSKLRFFFHETTFRLGLWGGVHVLKEQTILIRLK
jgi:hypothetical protein